PRVASNRSQSPPKPSQAKNSTNPITSQRERRRLVSCCANRFAGSLMASGRGSGRAQTGPGSPPQVRADVGVDGGEVGAGLGAEGTAAAGGAIERSTCTFSRSALSV